MQQKLTKLCCYSVAAVSIFSSCGKRKVEETHGDRSAKLNQKFFEDVGKVKSYINESSFSEALEKCVYIYENFKGCSFKDLPLIGQGKDIITKEDILKRTVTSHKFLADNFSKFLSRFTNEDIMMMFGSVNAIVISDHIKPSFYWARTGAIYLSSDYFWLLEEELNKLKKRVDKRKNYGKKFKFSFLKTVAQDGENIFNGLKKKVRTLDDVHLPVMRLLFHELAHANDYYPRSFYSQISKLSNRYYYDIFKERLLNKELVSDNLPWKLNSDILKSIGQVSFKGKKASANQLKLSASQVIREFKKDMAVAFYSYSTSREDFAMLMEQFFMLSHYNVESYTSVLDFNKKNVSASNIKNFPIKWGVKNRILIPHILDRARFGLKSIMPNRNYWRYENKLNNHYHIEIPQGVPYKNVVNY